eukprot:1004638-Pyramimonas_sp.AAC.2
MSELYSPMHPTSSHLKLQALMTKALCGGALSPLSHMTSARLLTLSATAGCSPPSTFSRIFSDRKYIRMDTSRLPSARCSPARLFRLVAKFGCSSPTVLSYAATVTKASHQRYQSGTRLSHERPTSVTRVPHERYCHVGSR